MRVLSDSVSDRISLSGASAHENGIMTENPGLYDHPKTTENSLQAQAAGPL